MNIFADGHSEWHLSRYWAVSEQDPKELDKDGGGEGAGGRPRRWMLNQK